MAAASASLNHRAMGWVCLLPILRPDVRIEEEAEAAAPPSFWDDPAPSCPSSQLQQVPLQGTFPPPHRVLWPSSAPQSSPAHSPRLTNKVAPSMRTASCSHSFFHGEELEACWGSLGTIAPSVHVSMWLEVPWAILRLGAQLFLARMSPLQKGLPLFLQCKATKCWAVSNISFSQITLWAPLWLSDYQGCHSLIRFLSSRLSLTVPDWMASVLGMAPCVSCFLLAVLISASCRAIPSSDPKCTEVSPNYLSLSRFNCLEMLRFSMHLYPSLGVPISTLFKRAMGCVELFLCYEKGAKELFWGNALTDS